MKTLIHALLPILLLVTGNTYADEPYPNRPTIWVMSTTACT